MKIRVFWKYGLQSGEEFFEPCEHGYTNDEWDFLSDDVKLSIAKEIAMERFEYSYEELPSDERR